MAEFLRFDYDVRALDRAFDDLPDVTRKAAVNALNKVGRMANAAVRKFIVSEYNIKSRSLRLGNLVTLRRADARKDRFVFTIFIRRRGRGLMKYGAIQESRGVSVRVKQSRKTIRHAFLSTWRRGEANRFVFVRDLRRGTVTRATRKGTAYKTAKRRALFGPGIAALYGSRRSKRLIDETIEKNYRRILDEEFKRQFERRR